MIKKFNYAPYYDDFDEDKNFMQVLFRPGYSVQARELTQLQSIIKSQIEKFGNHIFKDGSPITGGKISLDDKSNYILLETQYNGQDIDVTLFDGATIVSYDSSKKVRAKVVTYDNSSSTPILILKYLSGDVFNEGDDLQIEDQNVFARLKSTAAVGRSYTATIQPGVYYFNGQFINVHEQSIVLETFYRLGYNSYTINKLPSYKIGIEFESVVVDEIDDVSLLDPAQESTNYQAPGATRYQVNAILSKRTLDSVDTSNFFEVVRVENGIKTKEVVYPIYGDIEKTMARRTYDESGNYVVDPFILTISLGPTEATVTAALDPGKAYVAGYEFQTIAPTNLIVDRARTTANVSEFDLPTSYSSTVVLSNIHGGLDITSFPQVDVHCVDRANVNMTSATAYSNTVIGNLNVSMLTFNSATTNKQGNTHTLLANVFDVNGSSIKGAVVSAASANTVTLPSILTSANNAYNNLYFRLTDSASAVSAPSKILAYNGSTKTITLETPLSVVPSSANTFSIDGNFKNARSLVSDANTAFMADISTQSIDTVTGDAFITEPTRSSLIFSVPQDSIVANTISNLDIYVRKEHLNTVSDGAMKITLSTENTDTFAFAETPGVLSEATILANMICFVKPDSVANATSGIFPNTILSLSNTNFTVTAVSNTQIDVLLTDVGVKANFLIKTKLNNAEAASLYISGKQLTPLDSANLQAAVAYSMGGANTLPNDANSTATAISTGVTVFEALGATFFSNTATTALTSLRTPGTPVSLYVPDVVEIVRITASGDISTNVTTAMLSDPAYDVTNRYDFNTGQTPTYYDHASIKLKRGFSSPVGTIYVQYNYLKRQSPTGLFTVDSYLKTGSGYTYANIGKFTDNTTDKTVSLRSVLDFRPTRGVGIDTLSGALHPDPLSTAKISYQYYLSRIDRIVLTPSRNISIIKGRSSINPIAPAIGTDDMLLYTLYVPAYTESYRDIIAEFKDNRRYTMSDISKVDQRVKNLEFYVSLSALEKSAADTKVLDSNGLERSKYGLVVDNFTSYEVQASPQDVGFDNRCLIENGELQPASLMRTVKIDLAQSGHSGTYKIIGVDKKKVMLLNYNPVVYAAQPYATTSIGVTSAIFANHLGKMKLYPEFDSQVDTNTTAKVVINSVKGLDNIFNIINAQGKAIAEAEAARLVEDQNNPFAKISDAQYVETKQDVTVADTSGAVQGGKIAQQGSTLTTTTNKVLDLSHATLTTQALSSSSGQQDLGNYVTNVSVTPWMYPREVFFCAQGLRPKTTMWSFFDGVPVSEYVIRPSRIRLTAVPTVPFKIGELATMSSAPAWGPWTHLPLKITGYVQGDLDVDVINETGYPISGNLVGLDSGATATISAVLEHNSGVTRSKPTGTVQLQSDFKPNGTIVGERIIFVRSAGEEGMGYVFHISAYDDNTKIATLSANASLWMPNAGTTAFPNISLAPWFPSDPAFWIYSIGINKSNAKGQASGIFCIPRGRFHSGQRKFRVTESFNNTYNTENISFADADYVSSGLKLDKTNLVDTVYNIGTDSVSSAMSGSVVLSSATQTSYTPTTYVPDPPPKPTPDGTYLTATRTGAAEITLSWNAIPNVEGYIIYFWPSQADVLARTNRVALSTPAAPYVSTTYVHGSLPAGQEYWYEVHGYDSLSAPTEQIGIASNLAHAPTSAAAPATPPNVPGNLNVYAGAYPSQNNYISWTAPDPVGTTSGYNLYWTTGRNAPSNWTAPASQRTLGSSATGSAYLPGAGTLSYIHQGLDLGQTYNYVITAVNTIGQSGISDCKNGTLGVAPPAVNDAAPARIPVTPVTNAMTPCPTRPNPPIALTYIVARGRVPYRPGIIYDSALPELFPGTPGYDWSYAMPAAGSNGFTSDNFIGTIPAVYVFDDRWMSTAYIAYGADGFAPNDIFFDYYDKSPGSGGVLKYTKKAKFGISQVPPGSVFYSMAIQNGIGDNTYTEVDEGGSTTVHLDPLAQTFIVDKTDEIPNGIFLDSIDLFFKAKDTSNNVPVQIEIRPTVNGAPHADFWYPESVVYKYPASINVSDEPPSITDTTKATNFKFDVPVFLRPGFYAVVIKTESPDYVVWISELGGTTQDNKRVESQPYVGTLYKSQNAMEYTPLTNNDLMFRLNRCVFDQGTATFKLENQAPLFGASYNVDKFRLIETAINDSHPAVEMHHYARSTPLGGVLETELQEFTPHGKYSYGNDHRYPVGFRRREIANTGDFKVDITMSTRDPAISPVVNVEGLNLNVWENFIDNAEINLEDFNIVTSGGGYSNANTIVITSTAGTGASVNIATNTLGNVVSFNVNSSGSGYLDAFTIAYPLTPNVTSNATIVLNSEFDSSGGPCLARYITKPIALADGFDAGDLRIYLSANKPGVSEVTLFYKVLSDHDTTDFKNRPYVKMVCINPTTTPSPDDSTYREYEYRPSATVNAITYTSDNGATYTSFNKFAIKVVMTSSDPAIVPKVKDLRIIALPAE